MWNPVRADSTDIIIINYAKKGIERDLGRLNKKIKKLSDSLRLAHDNNATTRRMAKMRTNLSLECEQRDRLEKALCKLKG